MPDESCRKCGGKLNEYAKCSRCSQAVLRVCLGCGKFAEKRFHSACFYNIDKLQAGISFREGIAS
jgi:hypothetical protein